MALIKCPECGRENVSDSAEMCPNCGYGIKSHFDRLRKEEERREQIRKEEEIRIREEIEEKEREEQRIKSVPQLKKPQLTGPIIIFVISASCIILGILQLGASEWEVERSINHARGDPHFYGGLYLILGIVLACYGIYILSKCIERYKLSKTDLEKYQRLVIKEQDEVIASAQAMALAKAREESMKPECPYCHSRNTTKITATSKVVNTAMFGILGQKRKFQWHCNKCKSNF